VPLKVNTHPTRVLRSATVKWGNRISGVNRITFSKSIFKGYQPLNDSQRKRTVWQCFQRKQKARNANCSVDVTLKNTFGKSVPIHPILRYFTCLCLVTLLTLHVIDWFERSILLGWQCCQYHRVPVRIRGLDFDSKGLVFSATPSLAMAPPASDAASLTPLFQPHVVASVASAALCALAMCVCLIVLLRRR